MTPERRRAIWAIYGEEYKWCSHLAAYELCMSCLNLLACAK